MKQFPSEEELIAECERLGIDVTGDPITRSSSGSRKADASQLQQRLLNFKAHQLNSKMWILALVSAIASLVSAAAACIAIYVK